MMRTTLVMLSALVALSACGPPDPPPTAPTPQPEPTPASTYLADLFRKQLTECLEEDEAGRPTLTVKLPDRSALDALAASLGWLLAEHAAPAPSERNVRGRGASRAPRRQPPSHR